MICKLYINKRTLSVYRVLRELRRGRRVNRFVLKSADTKRTPRANETQCEQQVRVQTEIQPRRRIEPNGSEHEHVRAHSNGSVAALLTRCCCAVKLLAQLL